MNNFKGLILLAFIFIVTSCSVKQKKERKKLLESIIESNIGTTLDLPDSLLIYEPFENFKAEKEVVNESSFKIFTHVNVSCGSCLAALDKWKSIMPEFHKLNIPLVILCESDDNFELFKYLCESNKIKSFPANFYFDINNKYLDLNLFTVQGEGFETVLTDENNNIILIGNPILSERIKDLYIDVVSR